SVVFGGNFHGAGPNRNASTASIEANSSIKADAITFGNGGNIAVWSNGLTTVGGLFSARGGANSGNGGFIETSGHQLKVASGTKVTTLAPNGNAGMWLLDPNDFVI